MKIIEFDNCKGSIQKGIDKGDMYGAKLKFTAKNAEEFVEILDRIKLAVQADIKTR